MVWLEHTWKAGARQKLPPWQIVMVKVTTSGSITEITSGGNQSSWIISDFGVLCYKSVLKFSKGFGLYVQDSVRLLLTFMLFFIVCQSQVRKGASMTSWPTLQAPRMRMKRIKRRCLNLSSLTDLCCLATTSRCPCPKGERWGPEPTHYFSFYFPVGQL